MENVKIIGCGYAYGSNCVTNDMLKNVVMSGSSQEPVSSSEQYQKMKIPVIWQSELPKKRSKKIILINIKFH